MIETTLQFSLSDEEPQSYFLLELPSDLAKEIESQEHDLEWVDACEHCNLLVSNVSYSWTIRGRDTDDAVLCTKEKTYTLRSVVVSNALCLMTGSSSSEDGEVVLRETIHEILEVTPCLAKLHRLHDVLRGHEYDEGVGQEVSDDEYEESSRPVRMLFRPCVLFLPYQHRLFRKSVQGAHTMISAASCKQATLNSTVD